VELGFGIVLLILGLLFLYGTVQMYPPGKMRRNLRMSTTWNHILIGAILSFIALWVGIYLIWGLE
jgi:hypothetical protein